MSADPIIAVLERLAEYAGNAEDRDARLYCQVQIELRREQNVAQVVRVRNVPGRFLVVEGKADDAGFGARKIVGEANARRHGNLALGVQKGGRVWHLDEMQATFGDYEVTEVKEYRP